MRIVIEEVIRITDYGLRITITDHDHGSRSRIVFKDRIYGS
ncbi:hypothetical protein [Paenibacillus sp. J2TS4]|nr:hypothetical protein [Paenibacillus sp. J2TS4]